MQAVVHGRPAEYSLEVMRVLHDKYVMLHMKDLGVPSRYEANVYIGCDTTGSRYVTHWIDVFGASWSTTLGEGRRSADTLVIMFQYRDGPFRDRFIFDSAKDTWRLLMHSGDRNGSWKPFADYTVTRKK